MSKPRTQDDFSDQISQDRTWRLKEISDLKSAAKNAPDKNLETVLLRSLVTICYAHWEGHIRFSAKKYMEFIALRKLRYSDLKPQFFKNRFLPRLDALSQSRQNVKEKCNLIDEILNKHTERFSHVNEKLIDTRSNLNTSVISDICRVCDIPSNSFEDRDTFVDVMLLKRRNEIAHGENTLIDLNDIDELANETMGLMRRFSDALENQIYLDAYKAESVGA